MNILGVLKEAWLEFTTQLQPMAIAAAPYISAIFALELLLRHLIPTDGYALNTAGSLANTVLHAMVLFSGLQVLFARRGEPLVVTTRIVVTYLVASTYIGLAIVIGLFLFVIPGLIVMAVTYLTPIYILKHAQGPIEAVASSASAMRDCILPVMALFLGLSFLEAGIEMCLTYAADMIELPNIIAQLVIAGIGIIASLFMLTLMVKVYVRVSQEA
jgi:hypothetical protein